MIWFNNHEVYGTANYYVQQLFMHHQGDHLLKIEANGFERPLAKPASPITGKLSLGTDLCSVQYWDIQLINDETGEVKHLAGLDGMLSDTQEDRLNGTVVKTQELDETDWGSYTLRFKAKKISGPKGFDVYFGKNDDENQLIWEIGGWQNQDSAIVSKVDGRGSCLTQSLFTVETGIAYEFALEVSGRRIRTYVDGVLINDTEDKLPVIEPLYFSASADQSTGDIMVKVVNVQEISAAAQVVLTDLPQAPTLVEVFELSGYALDEANDFESPNRILPKRKELQIEANSFFYDFPKHSVTIFRVK